MKLKKLRGIYHSNGITKRAKNYAEFGFAQNLFFASKI